jgi:hypothetical protein
MLPASWNEPPIVPGSRPRDLGNAPVVVRAARRARSRAPARLLVALFATLAGAIAVVGQEEPAWPPPTLRDTGLYADWDAKRVAAGHLAYSPQYPLWTDGAAKARWLSLPPGTWIDASDPDEWRFPVGTRLWKEFRFARRAETRFIELTASGWRYATYLWNDDETEAVLAPAGGVRRSVEIRPGVHHAIPSRADCTACHEGGAVRALGVSALQLSPDRDPNAPHAEAVPPGAVDLPGLAARGLVRGLPQRADALAPRIEAPTPVARAALGYLHANCGSCHVAGGELASLELVLNYSLATSAGELPAAVLTTFARPSRARIPGLPTPADRVSPGDPEASVLLARVSSRHPVRQMPPLGSRIVDDEGVRLIRQWIAEQPGARPTTRHDQEEEER